MQHGENKIKSENQPVFHPSNVPVDEVRPPTELKTYLQAEAHHSPVQGEDGSMPIEAGVSMVLLQPHQQQQRVEAEVADLDRPEEVEAIISIRTSGRIWSITSRSIRCCLW